MIGLDPEAIWELGFEHEANLPAERRTFLRCHFVTARQYMRIGELMTEANGGPEGTADMSTARRLEVLGQALALVAVGWRRPAACPGAAAVVETFDAARLPDLLTIEEHWELAAGLRTESRLPEQDRKKSASRSASAATATPAGGAPAAGA